MSVAAPRQALIDVGRTSPTRGGQASYAWPPRVGDVPSIGISPQGAVAGCRLSGAERIVCVEDAAELAPPHPHVVHLVARVPNVEGAGAVTVRDLVRQALRMRPDRIVVGEVRGREVVDLLTALKAGEADDARKRLFGRRALVVVQIAGSLVLLIAASETRPGSYENGMPSRSQ